MFRVEANFAKYLFLGYDLLEIVCDLIKLEKALLEILIILVRFAFPGKCFLVPFYFGSPGKKGTHILAKHLLLPIIQNSTRNQVLKG